MLNKLKALWRLYKLLPQTNLLHLWEPEDAANFHAFLKTPSGVKFSITMRELIFKEAQRQCTSSIQSSDWRVGYVCGIQGAMTYIDQMAVILEDEDEDHDN